MTVKKLTHKRLSFPQIWTPKAIVDQKTGVPGPLRYGFALIITPDDPQVQELEELFDQLAYAKWKEKASVYMREIRSKDRTPLHNGDFKADYEGYPGNYYIQAYSANQPLIVDRDPFCRNEDGTPMMDPKTGKPIPNLLTEKHGRPYGGCFVNASIDFYAQDTYGNRINATARGVQFVSDGDAFSGGPPATPEEFDSLEVGGQQSLA